MHAQFKNIMNTHKKKIINPPKDTTARTFNCTRKHQCSPNEKCLEPIIPNEENSKTKIYYGFSETTFKLRYANHKKNSATSNVKIMQYYQTNIGISCQQTKLSWKILGTHKSCCIFLKDVFYVSMKH